jgi:hypothetical protein
MEAGRGKTMLFFNGDDNAHGTEEFRTLRSRIYHTREKMALKKILVTSALPKRGQVPSPRRTWRRCWCGSTDAAYCLSMPTCAIRGCI